MREGCDRGWFLQDRQGHQLVWHSGWEPDAYSAMYLKVADKRLTLIVLANTEGLSWGNSLVRAEIENSPVAKRFLEASRVSPSAPDPAPAPPRGGVRSHAS